MFFHNKAFVNWDSPLSWGRCIITLSLKLCYDFATNLLDSCVLLLALCWIAFLMLLCMNY